MKMVSDTAYDFWPKLANRGRGGEVWIVVVRAWQELGHANLYGKLV
jgi:hypothetical protein